MFLADGTTWPSGPRAAVLVPVCDATPMSIVPFTISAADMNRTIAKPSAAALLGQDTIKFISEPSAG